MMTVELTEKALALFKVLKENEGVNMTAAQIAEAMNEKGGHPAFGDNVTSRQISGAATALSNKKLATRVEDTVEVDGKKKIVKYIQLTDEGRMAEATLKVEQPKKPRKKKDADAVEAE